jgi:hypothetical protein
LSPLAAPSRKVIRVETKKTGTTIRAVRANQRRSEWMCRAPRPLPDTRTTSLRSVAAVSGAEASATAVAAEAAEAAVAAGATADAVVVVVVIV